MGTAQLEWPPAVGKYGPLGGFGPTLLGCVWMMFFLCTLTIGLRIFTRYYCQKWAGWALFWTILSWVCPRLVLDLVPQLTMYPTGRRSDRSDSAHSVHRPQSERLLGLVDGLQRSHAALDLHLPHLHRHWPQQVLHRRLPAGHPGLDTPPRAIHPLLPRRQQRWFSRITSNYNH